MLDFILFIVGIIALIKGDFRIGSRFVPPQQGRLVGLILMSPFIFVACIGSFLILSRLDMRTIERADSRDVMALLERPEIAEVVAQLALLELIGMVIAIGAAVFIIAGIPPSDGTPNTFTEKPKPSTAFDMSRADEPNRSQPSAPRTPRSHPLDREAPELPARPMPQQRPVQRPTPATAVPAAPPNLMTVEQAAVYTKLTPEEILALIENSQLGAVRNRGSYIIARSALDDYLGRDSTPQ